MLRPNYPTVSTPASVHACRNTPQHDYELTPTSSEESDDDHGRSDEETRSAVATLLSGMSGAKASLGRLTQRAKVKGGIRAPHDEDT
eukprot:2077883-Prymnesium_polylepis.1